MGNYESSYNLLRLVIIEYGAAMYRTINILSKTIEWIEGIRHACTFLDKEDRLRILEGRGKRNLVYNFPLASR